VVERPGKLDPQRPRHVLTLSAEMWRRKTWPHCTLFGTQHLHGRLYPLPLHLASSCTYASTHRLPDGLQGSVPGPWL